MRILLLSDRMMLRKTISKLISVIDDSIEIINCPSSPDHLGSKTDTPFDLILVDCGVSDEAAVLDVLFALLSVQAEANIAILLDEQNDVVIDSAMNSGALAVIVKSVPPETLVTMLETTLAGNRCRPAPSREISLDDIPEKLLQQLTPVQRTLLQLISGGCSISSAASQMHLTPVNVVLQMRRTMDVIKGRSLVRPRTLH